MDNLHHVIRNIRESKSSRRDHLAVFREFICELDRIGRRKGRNGKGSRRKWRRSRSDPGSATTASS